MTSGWPWGKDMTPLSHLSLSPEKEREKKSKTIRLVCTSSLLNSFVWKTYETLFTKVHFSPDFSPLKAPPKIYSKCRTWSWVCTSMCWWLVGTGTNWGSLLLSHMVTSRFMLTANGSYPSCRPQMVKYFRVLTSLPKFILPTWTTPRLHTGIKPGDGQRKSNTCTKTKLFGLYYL